MADVGQAYLKLLPTVVGLRAALRTEIKTVEDTKPKVRVGVEFKDTGLAEAVRAAVALAGLRAPQITLGARINVPELRAQVWNAAREISDEKVTVTAEADVTPVRRDLDRLHREESGRDLQVNVVMAASLGTALRGMSALDSSITRSTTTITRHTTAVGLATLRYAAFAAVAGQMVTVLGGLAGIAATASGSLLLLPAAGIAAAVAVNVLKLGTAGFADALTEADPAKFAEAIGEFPPAMQATARAVRDLQGDFGSLRLDVQQRLFAGLADEVAGLGALHLPAVRRGLWDMADSLNASARGFGLWAREARTVDDVRIILGNSASSMGELSRGVAPVLSGLRDIAAVGSGFLPALASGLAEGAVSFGDFIARARETGQLQQWISGGLSALGELFTLLGNIARIVGAVFTAADAGGSSMLTTLNALTGSLAAFLSSGEGSVALQQIFTGLGAVAQALVPLLAAVGQAVVTSVAPAIAGLGPMIAAAFEVLAAAAQPAGQILAALAPLAGVAAQAVASVLAPALGALSGIVSELAPAAALLVQELVGGALADGVRELTPSLIELARAASPLIVQFGRLLVQAVQTVVPALVSLLAVLTPIAAQLGGALLTAVSAALPLIGQLAELWSQVLLAGLQAALPILPVVVSTIQQLASVLSVGLAAATPHLIELGRLLGEVLSTALIGLLPLLPPLAEAWLKIWAEGLLPMQPLLLELVATLLPAAVELITALLPVVLQVADLTATWTSMIAAHSGEIRQLIPVIQFLLNNVVVPIFRSIVDTIGGALQILQGIFTVASAVLRGDWSRAWSGLGDIVSGGARLIVGVVDAMTGGLLTVFGGLPRRILGALGDLNSLLTEAGRSIIRGLLRGIEAGFQAVRDALARLTSMLPSWKGPPEVDRELLRGNGFLVMDGFLSGLRDGEPQVRRYLTGLTDALPADVAGRGGLPGSAGTATTSVVTATGNASAADLSAMADAVAAGVLAALDGARLRVDGTGVARLVNTANVRNARR